MEPPASAMKVLPKGYLPTLGASSVAIHGKINNDACEKIEWKEAPLALHLVPRSLKYVEVVAQIGSIQGASRELGLAASAINRQILLLEESLGVKLFERRPSGMSPTAAGEAFIVLARRWGRDVGRLVSDVEAMQGTSLGHVRLAAMDSQANGVLPQLVGRMAAELPRVELEVEIVSPHQAIVAVSEGTADIALAVNVRPRKDLRLLCSMELPLGCVASPAHPLAGARATTLKEVARHPVALQSRSLAIRRYLEEEHGWPLPESPRLLVTNSLQLVKQLALAGSHLALTSELDAAPEIASGRLVFVPIRDRGVAPQTVAVAVDARRTLPRVADVVGEMLCEAVTRALAETRT